jgi:hypothetical protein
MECYVPAGLIHIKANDRHSPQNALIPPAIPVRTDNCAKNP